MQSPSGETKLVRKISLVVQDGSTSYVSGMPTESRMHVLIEYIGHDGHCEDSINGLASVAERVF